MYPLLLFFLTTALHSTAYASLPYDYIIIGAGTSGLPLANRLSSDPSISVAIIEPGSDQRSNTLVSNPEAFGQSFGTEIDWVYPLTHDGRNLTIPAGKAWGGTSVLNGMTYVRGEAAAIDAWGELDIKNWSWKKLFPYYKASEDYAAPGSGQVAAGASFAARYHGVGGPLKVGYTKKLVNGSFSASVMGAWEEVGLRKNLDLNGGKVRGYGMGPQTLDVERGVRWDAARAYYFPVAERDNLRIIRGTATRVAWKKERHGGKTVAAGVFYSDGEKEIRVDAKREVILSSGSLRTPLLLERSGVGSRDVLEKLGIETVVDLPGVGHNLGGQPGHLLMFEGTLDPSANAYHTYVDVEDIYGDKKNDVEAETRQDIGKWAQDIVDSSPARQLDTKAVKRVLETQHDLLFKKRAAVAEIQTIVLEGLLLTQFWILQPFSKGSVHLRSTSVEDMDKPVITPRYYSADFDIASAIDVVKFIHRFLNATAISRNVGARLSPTYEVLPANATDAQWTTYLKGACK